MSQAGLIDAVGTNPDIPTSFVTDSGIAIPIANVLQVLGGTGITTSGATNVITITATGTVGSINVDAATPPGTDPVVPNGAGQITVTGGQVAAGVVGTNVIRTDSLSANTYTIEIQRSSAQAVSTVAANGVSHFSSAQFAVDANGFVTLAGGGEAIDSFLPDSGTSPVVPNAAGAVTMAGSGSITTVGGLNSLTTQLTGLTNHAVLVGAGTTTITKVGPSASTGQVLQNNAAADPSYSTATYPSTTTINQILYSSAANTVVGLATANNGVLITSATGVPSLLPNGTTGQVLTATTGSPPSWAAAASSISITGDSGGALTGAAFTFTGGTTGLTFAGSGSTETLGGTLVVANGGTGRTTLTNHGVLVGAATTAITQLAAGSAGQVLQSGGASADPAYSTATYPSTATGTGTILRADGTNWVATTATYPATTTSQQILYSTAANVVGQLTTANSALAATNSSGTLAMRAFSVNIQVFNTSGTYTPTAGMLYCVIRLVGGGGGGGGITGSATASNSTSGGGSGAYSESTFSAATIGASQTVTIGAGGTAGAAANGNGGAGGTTSVGALITAGGGGGATGAAIGLAGAGGTAGTGTFAVAGMNGGTGGSSAALTSLWNTNYGGSSLLGPGGSLGTSAISTASAGQAGIGPGGGGSGANGYSSASSFAGGAGAAGRVIITEYVIA